MRTLLAALTLFSVAAAIPLSGGATSADACAGLIGSNGAVNLGRTTTLAAYHDGTEHYVTAFEFQGGGGEFGTLIPLPDVPTTVERGGDWTLQRLQRETTPVAVGGVSSGDNAGLEFAARAEVILEVTIDALDLTVLRGGGPDVAVWAEEHGFRLSPDAPEVLQFYADRSPIFLAAVFNGDAAAERGQQIGDGTPVHITMPTDDPWVPLRILGLGKQDEDFIQADVFLLTDEEPAILPGPHDGLFLAHSDAATDLLLADLRSDAGMEWMPESAWLTKLQIDTPASNLKYDLAIDANGNNPSRVDAGLGLGSSLTPRIPAEGDGISALWYLAGAMGVLAAWLIVNKRFSGAR